LELWLWDPQTKIASKGLLSSYTPAGFKLLPDNSGFSFIDNGRIKLKKYDKRAPQSIDIYEPVYNINLIEWIDADSFYLSAKKNDLFHMFQMNSCGSIELMLQDPLGDCMYPQKVGQYLFYVERIKKGGYKRGCYLSYKVVQIDYPDIHKNISHEILPQTISKDQKQEIIHFKGCPIAFLQMISENEGFFLEHPAEVDRHDRTIPFSYYQIKKVDLQWECKELFQFDIPSYLFLNTSDFRLYESILPMLPKYYNNQLYFIDCPSEQDLTLDIFCYDFQTDDVEQKTFGKSGQLSFSPIFVDNEIFFGGIVDPNDMSSQIMWMNEDGDVCIDLPKM